MLDDDLLAEAQLLAAAMLTDARLWTRDRRLRAAAERLGVEWAPQPAG